MGHNLWQITVSWKSSHSISLKNAKKHYSQKTFFKEKLESFEFSTRIFHHPDFSSNDWCPFRQKLCFLGTERFEDLLDSNTDLLQGIIRPFGPFEFLVRCGKWSGRTLVFGSTTLAVLYMILHRFTSLA